jgi:hypothetical protein
MSSPEIKNISLYPKGKSRLRIRPSHPTRGADHDRHERAVGCGGREVRKTRRMTRTAKACGPDVAVLASMHLEATASEGATEAKEPFSGESTL